MDARCFCAPLISRNNRKVGPKKWLFKQKEYVLESFGEDLQDLYLKSVLPVEEAYLFHKLLLPKMEKQEFFHTPMVLVLGPCSVGKTTTIRYIMNSDYPGSRVGAEPTTEYFTVIKYAESDRIIPGNVLMDCCETELKYLKRFGNQFLNYLVAAECNNHLLTKVTFVDTPGSLFSVHNSKPKLDASLLKPLEWFIQQADLVLLIVDAHQLNMSSQFVEIMTLLIRNSANTRIVLNKCDAFRGQELMRIYGAFMWSLTKIVPGFEGLKVSVASLWNRPPLNYALRHLFNAEKDEILNELRSLPKTALLSKIDKFITRSKLVLSNTSFFNEEQSKKGLLENLPLIFQGISSKHDIHIDDFPQLDSYKSRLEPLKFSSLKKLRGDLIQNINHMLNTQIPIMVDHVKTVSLVNDQFLALEGGIFEWYLPGSEVKVHPGDFAAAN